MISSRDIRSSFLEFFRLQAHTVVSSSSLVPGNDPTLLFTNSGMVQFKDVFLGADQRSYTRAASAQRCLRAGGKHNDLDQVGYTARHHTFFEMLGNFSFGDYFKRDAIHFAWNFLTVTLRLAPEKLWVTVYHTDDEAYALWNQEIGVPDARIVRIGDNKGAKFASDNFWQMADTGPCGPCSEIFYDHGEAVAGGPPGSPDGDGDRYIEIWNLVFMQFDRAPDGTLHPLPKPCVDTGMGLERLAAILQGVHSNYEIDTFAALTATAQALTGARDPRDPSLRVIADHIRACAFLIVDGVLPSNEGRGYVLRRIIRRAARHGYKLGQNELFFHRMVATLVEQMGDAYPDLLARAAAVTEVLKQEEERFAETLTAGMKIFEQLVSGLKSGEQIGGAEAFKLYDTYGFPLDLTEDVARERGLTVDAAGFEQAMNAQRERARAASGFGGVATVSAEQVARMQPTEFLGYEHLAFERCTVIGLLQQGQALERIEAPAQVYLVLDRTPFYAESGGQVGDSGTFSASTARGLVRDTVKLTAQHFAHVCDLQAGTLRVGMTLDVKVDADRRLNTVLNHSATHLMHAALRRVLGDHVQQKGSLVAPDRLRFDFSHFKPMSSEEVAQVEAMVNTQVRRNAPAQTELMGFDAAIASGAMALFGEKYGENVRVLQFADFSTELCGGTHVERAGDIGLFKILSETGVAAGVRRIEAVTGLIALQVVTERERELNMAAELLKASPELLIERIKALLERTKKMEKDLEILRGKAASLSGDELLAKARQVGSVRLLVSEVPALDQKQLRDLLDQVRNKLGDGISVLATRYEGKASIVVGVSEGLKAQFKAGDLANHVAAQIGGKGGGRPDMAQAGGSNLEALESALNSVDQWVLAHLKM